MCAQSQNEKLTEVYLQISPNILESFPKFRPPVALYRLDPELGQVRRYHKAKERLSRDRQKKVADFADHGMLFLHREDYRVCAQHLSRNLGLVLIEDDFTPQEVAEIFYLALWKRMNEFLGQPTEAPLQSLTTDLSILVEYLWVDPVRVEYLVRSLHTEYDLATHSVNTMFVGVALYTMLVQGRYEQAALVSLALGLILHDLGMANVPKFIVDKPRKLLHNDRPSVEHHIEAGLSKLNRLRLRDPTVIQCMTLHHERVDGSGYPNRVMKESLNLPGRLCGLADAFSALISARPYRKAKDLKEAAITLLQDGGRFDPVLAKLLAVLVTKGVGDYIGDAA
ncbi:HD-GYP domain-containing protein [Pseudodesulfovibrio sp.]|uniref:HD-GYP domain-containing protein n=1 Tax=unclassified Pseudodesulfovibrio TaxID=2661612 RepID=UPI003AFFE58D